MFEIGKVIGILSELGLASDNAARARLLWNLIPTEAQGTLRDIGSLIISPPRSSDPDDCLEAAGIVEDTIACLQLKLEQLDAQLLELATPYLRGLAGWNRCLAELAAKHASPPEASVPPAEASGSSPADQALAGLLERAPGAPDPEVAP